MMWLPQISVVVFSYFLTVDASTTVLPRPPADYLHSPSFELTTPSLEDGRPHRGLEITAATPSHQSRQIPPPPAPRYIRMTTPGYQNAPPHFRLLWAEPEDTIPQNSPLPLTEPTQPFHF